MIPKKPKFKNLTSVNINIPIIISFDDYHEISYIENILKNIIPNIKSYEINVEDDLDEEIDGNYYGLYYIGNKPNKNEIKKLFEENLY